MNEYTASSRANATSSYSTPLRQTSSQSPASQDSHKESTPSRRQASSQKSNTSSSLTTQNRREEKEDRRVHVV